MQAATRHHALFRRGRRRAERQLSRLCESWCGCRRRFRVLRLVASGFCRLASMGPFGPIRCRATRPHCRRSRTQSGGAHTSESSGSRSLMSRRLRGRAQHCGRTLVRRCPAGSTVRARRLALSGWWSSVSGAREPRNTPVPQRHGSGSRVVIPSAARPKGSRWLGRPDVPFASGLYGESLNVDMGDHVAPRSRGIAHRSQRQIPAEMTYGRKIGELTINSRGLSALAIDVARVDD